MTSAPSGGAGTVSVPSPRAVGGGGGRVVGGLLVLPVLVFWVLDLLVPTVRTVRLSFRRTDLLSGTSTPVTAC